LLDACLAFLNVDTGNDTNEGTTAVTADDNEELYPFDDFLPDDNGEDVPYDTPDVPDDDEEDDDYCLAPF
jgi:hypothetical protein